jgi:hypothetical protein
MEVSKSVNGGRQNGYVDRKWVFDSMRFIGLKDKEITWVLFAFELWS